MRDVVVVGGGPAGLYSALLLAQEGFDVRLLEEHENLGAPTHCTGVVSDEITDLFKIPESIVLNRPTTCLVHSPAGRTLALHSNEEGIAVIDRGEFDRELGRAALRAGVEIRTGSRVTRVRVEPARVRIEGGDEMTSARACILACGVGYGLLRQVGLGLPSRFLHSAQVEIDARDVLRSVEVYLGRDVAPEGYGWVVPVLRDDRPRMKVGVVARGDAEQALRRLLNRPGLADAPRSAEPPLRRLLPIMPARQTYGHRVLTVGDAAGLVKPTTGGGIFYSLLSGLLAAETLTGALRRDRLEASDLKVYEGRWRARLGHDLRISGCVRRLFARLTDSELERLLDALGSEDVQSAIRCTARFNWHGEPIRRLLGQPGVKSTLFRTLLR